MKDIKKVKIGIIQSTATADTVRNIEVAKEQIHAAAKDGAQIICLQELFSSLYFCDAVDHKNFQLAEPVPGPTTEQLQVIAAQLDVVIIASLFEERTAGLYHNSTAVIDADGNYLGKYRKSHIPDDPGFYEKFYFAPGDTGYRMFQTKYARIGVLICWDQWYPEAARITALKGAEILFYPTAIGWDITEASAATNAEQYAAWQTIQRSHAIANGVHVVAVNRTGIEAGTKFWGGSFVANPFGTILYEASHDKNETKVIDIDIAQNEHYRQVWPFLRDRRIDTYKPILKRFL
jgi:N-carbamoylputrescine amidase